MGRCLRPGLSGTIKLAAWNAALQMEVVMTAILGKSSMRVKRRQTDAVRATLPHLTASGRATLARASDLHLYRDDNECSFVLHRRSNACRVTCPECPKCGHRTPVSGPECATAALVSRLDVRWPHNSPASFDNFAAKGLRLGVSRPTPRVRDCPKDDSAQRRDRRNGAG